MTCIVVDQEKDSKKIWIGADRRVTAYNWMQELVSPKFVIRDKYIIASSGNNAMGEIINNHVKLPKNTTHKKLEKYLQCEFHNVVSEIYSTRGSTKLAEGPGCETIIAYVVSTTICTDYRLEVDCVELKFPYASGSGGSYALGALCAMNRCAWSNKSSDFTIKDKMIIAIEIACGLDHNCGLPIDVICED